MHDCKCPNATECVEPTPCQHVQKKCMACMGPHPASCPHCPAWNTAANFRCSSSPVVALSIHNTNTHHLLTLNNPMTSCLLQFHSLMAHRICPDAQAAMLTLTSLHVHTLQMPVPSNWQYSSVWIPCTTIHLATSLPPSTSFSLPSPLLNTL